MTPHTPIVAYVNYKPFNIEKLLIAIVTTFP